MRLVYVAVILLILYKIKIFKNGEYNLDPLSMKNSNSIKGVAAIVVIVHHISQKLQPPGLLEICIYMGYLAVGIFLFLSGYGLMLSFNLKERYLEGFWKKRMPKILIPFFMANIIFLIFYTLVGNRYTLNEYISFILGIKLIDGFKWYIIATVILYSAFYFLFIYLEKSKAIIGMLIFVFIYAKVSSLTGKGIWWYNATHCFFIGILFAEEKERILELIKSKYFIYIVILLLGFVELFKMSMLDYGIIVAILTSTALIALFVVGLYKLEVGNKALNFLGGISYEIYLVQRLFLEEFLFIQNRYVYFLVCITSSVFVAYLFNKLVKKVWRLYSDRFLYKEEKSII